MAIYEVTALALLATQEGVLSSDARAQLRSSLESVTEGSSVHENAWTLRRALDHAYRQLVKG